MTSTDNIPIESAADIDKRRVLARRFLIAQARALNLSSALGPLARARNAA